MKNRFGESVMSKGGYYVGQPIAGNGEFGEMSLIEITKNEDRETCLQVIRPLNYEEQCSLCDAHATHYFGLFIKNVPAKNGTTCAMLYCKEYSPGLSGKIPPYPELNDKTGGGGSMV